MLIVLSGLLGFVADSLLTGMGLLRFPSGQFHPQFAPYWMVAMWMLFATTFNVSLRWLKPRLGLAALLGRGRGTAGLLRRGETGRSVVRSTARGFDRGRRASGRWRCRCC